MTMRDDVKAKDGGWRMDDQTATHRPPSSSLRTRWSPGSLLGLFQIVGRRLWSHLYLMLAIAAGFVVAIALVVSIPVYAEAVGYRVLRDELSRTETGGIRPPFAFMYRYLGSQHGLIDAAEYNKVDAYMRDTVAGRPGLPVQTRTRYVASDKLPLLPTSGAGAPLLYVNMAFLTDLEQNIELADGRLPETHPDGPVEVMITEALASSWASRPARSTWCSAPRPTRPIRASR